MRERESAVCNLLTAREGRVVKKERKNVRQGICHFKINSVNGHGSSGHIISNNIPPLPLDKQTHRHPTLPPVLPSSFLSPVLCFSITFYLLLSTPTSLSLSLCLSLHPASPLPPSLHPSLPGHQPAKTTTKGTVAGVTLAVTSCAGRKK